MASDDDIEKLKAQNFEEPITHDDEVGPVGNLFGSCVQILQALSTKARELDAASRENYHPDGPQHSESANESSSAQCRKEGRVRKMAKSGCVTCRKRKKMCDEGKPKCNKCVRDGFICDGYIIKSTQQKPEAPNSNPSGQETETFSESRQSLPLDGAASQLLVKTLESNVATLLFWDDEFGALSGHLDKALEHSEENRDLTLAILISLADFLSHDLLNATLPLPAYRDDIRQKSNIHARVDKARGIIMDTETPDREETRDIQDVCEILDSKVARLNVLGPILEESIPSGAVFEQVAAHGQLDDRPAYQYYADQISIRFPNASASLVEVLGKCNWERYMRIQKKREENTQREGSPIDETENMSKFHDSGLGTSVPAQSVFGVPQGSFVYAETEVSKRAEASHRRLPPLPEEGRRGCGFVCDICNRIVNIRRTGAWKKHIFSDVLAYVCIFDDCPSDRCFFEDRDALTAHLGNQHGFAPAWKSAKCSLCLEETGDGMNAISLHFARHMEEVALGAISQTAESDAGSDESSTVASSENGRSNSFELDEESREKGVCPVEVCGRVFRDLKAHMFTHIGEQASGPPEYTSPVMIGLPTPEIFPKGGTDGPTPIDTTPADYLPTMASVQPANGTPSPGQGVVPSLPLGLTKEQVQAAYMKYQQMKAQNVSVSDPEFIEARNLLAAVSSQIKLWKQSQRYMMEQQQKQQQLQQQRQTQQLQQNGTAHAATTNAAKASSTSSSNVAKSS